MRGVTCLWLFVLNEIYEFQLTRLMRGVTRRKANAADSDKISTHTPHARRDMYIDVHFLQLFHFNSHASCEA